MRLLAVISLMIGLSLGCGDSKSKDKEKPATVAATPESPTAPSEAPAPAAIPATELGNKVAAMYADIGAVVDTHGEDCVALAPAAVEALQKHMETLRSMSSTIGSPEARKWKEDNKQLTAKFRRQFAKVQSCARQDPALLEVFKKLGQIRRLPTR